jgi:hypothetical protein
MRIYSLMPGLIALISYRAQVAALSNNKMQILSNLLPEFSENALSDRT